MADLQTDFGSTNDPAYTDNTGAAPGGVISILKGAYSKLATISGQSPASLGQKTMANSSPVVIASDQPAISVSQFNAGTLTDRSGTVTLGATAQQLAAANAARKYFFFQNNSVGDLWINFGVTAVASQPSIKIIAGNGFSMENSFVSNQLVSVIGATTGQAFTAKEG